MIPERAMQAAVAALEALRESEDYLFTRDEVVAQVVIEAAAPHMLAAAKADALKEAAELIEPFSGIGLANGATRGDVARWLRERAAKLVTK